jgi:lipopolysaccharide export system permease protein
VNRIQKRYLKDFVLLLLGFSISLSIVFSIIFVVGEMDTIIKKTSSVEALVKVGLLKIPEFMKYILPLACLVSVLLVFGIAARKNEIIIIRSCGVDMRRFLLPIIGVSLVVVVINFVISEMVTPITTERINRMLHKPMKHVVYSAGGVWIRKRGGLIVRAGVFDPYTGSLKRVSLFWIKDGVLIKRMEAESGLWRGHDWALRNLYIYDLNKKRVIRKEKSVIKGVGGIEILKRARKRIDEMSVFSLIKYHNKLKALGVKNIKVSVDVHSRLSYPFTNLFMVLIGLCLSFSLRLLGGLLTMGLGIGIALLYWFSFTMALSFGYAGVVPPWLAGWSIPGLFGIIGLYLYRRIPV